MLPAQTLPTTATDSTPAATVPITIIRNGQPLEIEIDYALYLQLQEAIDEWQSAQRAAANYEAWKKDPSRGRPWEEVKAELIAEGLFDAE